jgi:type IV secretion system protein VirD4
VCIERCPHGSGGRGLYAFLPHDAYNTSETRGNSPSYGKNFQKLGKDLMSIDELAVMDGGMCILQLRGVRPFLSKKYDITKHPLYKYLSDFDKRNTFDIEKFLNTKLKAKPNDMFDVYEAEFEEPPPPGAFGL